ncbi:MAG: ACP S-malonyltransferase [Actinobacteria bacterium]|nr:ACP S-malonyltransferase [Actinomycetota bacterium]
MKERKRIVLLFPGQGTLKKGTGADLLETKYAIELDRKASSVIGFSLIEKIMQATEDDYSRTVFVQPATFFLSLLSYIILKEESEVFVVGAAGHSLGELTALTASGFFEIQTGFQLVLHRAKFMESCCRKELSSMVAVIGDNPLSLSSIAGYYGVYLANINSNQQVVFAGPVEGLKHFKDRVQELGYRAIYLNVEGAFHTPLMDEASTNFRLFLKKQKIGYNSFPVISNFDGKPYDRNNLIEKLSRQISSPVRWVDCIETLSFFDPDCWVETFPGNVLLRMLPPEIPGERIAIRSLSDIEKL